MGLDLKKLVEDLGPEYVILVRVHVNVRDAQGIPDDPQIIDVTDVPDINELYVVSDMQITDYSSTLFDYANLKRPMLLDIYEMLQKRGVVEENSAYPRNVEEFAALQLNKCRAVD